MVAIPKSRLFKCSINEQMLEYNGNNFLAYGVVCPQKTHAKEKKNVKKCITEIEKLTEYHNKKNDYTHTLDYNRKNFNADLGVSYMSCTPQQIFA
jgi:hypothetical protein